MIHIVSADIIPNVFCHRVLYPLIVVRLPYHAISYKYRVTTYLHTHELHCWLFVEPFQWIGPSTGG
jgi:hypothetical protein